MRRPSSSDPNRLLALVERAGSNMFGQWSTVLFHCHLVVKVSPSRLFPSGRRKKDGFISDKAFKLNSFGNQHIEANPSSPYDAPQQRPPSFRFILFLKVDGNSEICEKTPHLCKLYYVKALASCESRIAKRIFSPAAECPSTVFRTCLLSSLL